jgi:xylulokinase
MAKLLGIDIGTSGCKVLLIDETGKVLRQASAEYPLSVPQPLWSEQNPEDWWTGVVQCLSEIGEPNPDAIGVTGQMHGAVFLDEKDQVIRPAILWNDQRTLAECKEIDAVVGAERFREITCNPPLTGFQAPKLLWLRNHEPAAYAKVRSLLLPKDYIRFRLTGVKATEVSDASGTALFDVPRRAWSQEILLALQIDSSILPECFESSDVSATTSGAGGLAPGIPVVGGGGDQAAGAVGTGAVQPGIVSVSLGTSGVVFTALNSAEYDLKGAAHTFCHANRAWHAMGVMLSCGGALRWYRDTLAAGSTYDSLSAEAATAPIGADGLTFLPYLSGERTPHNDSLARGVLAGLTLGHARSHVSRSIFEGISFGLLDGFRLLQGLGATGTEIRITSGGAKSLFWVQMLADLFEAPCTTLESDEGPAFGAAVLAGVGKGIWPNVAEACMAAVRTKQVVTPTSSDYSKAYGRYRELYPATREWMGGS